MILEKGLSNILVVVTRYFGGILLGTGGLVRCYSGATEEALKKAEIIQKTMGYEAKINVDYSNLEALKYTLEKMNIKVLNIEYLKNIGVNALTITNPYILMFVKKYFKEDFKVRVSTFACIDSYTKAKYWEDLGADYLCVDFVKVNRDFKTLKYMVDNLKTAKIEILVTNSCLKNCPMIYTHTTGLSHASNKDKNSNSYEDWSLFYCQKKELENIEEYIRSPWVRPEDIKYYENIGIEHFKITERGFPTEEFVKRVKAYTDRKYEGNLLDLIQGHGVVAKDDLKLQRQSVNSRKEIYEEIRRVRGLGRQRECERHIYIDNKKLDNFITFFIDNKCTGNCNSCGYCNMIAKNVITKNKEVCDYLLELYNKYDEVKMDVNE